MSASYRAFFQPVRLLPLSLMKHVEKRVRVVVIADPTGARQLVVQMRVGTQMHLPFDLPQIHLDAQIVTPHLLQFDGDVFVNFPAPPPAAALNMYSNRGKPLPPG